MPRYQLHATGSSSIDIEGEDGPAAINEAAGPISKLNGWTGVLVKRWGTS